MAQQAEMTVAECSLTSCMWARFPIACSLDSCIVSSLRLHWVNGVCMLRCNLPLALLAEWPGSLTCKCGNMGVEWTQIRVNTQSQLWRRKFSCCSCQDLNSQPFNHKSSALNKLYWLTNNLSWLNRYSTLIKYIYLKCASSPEVKGQPLPTTNIHS